MVNEEILTALKNALDHGDSLETAKQIMINSGYNAREVDEASRFIGGGIIRDHQIRPEERLAMPNQKNSIFNRDKESLQKQMQQNSPQTHSEKTFIQQPSISQNQSNGQTQQLQRQQVSSGQIRQEITSNNPQRTSPQINPQTNPQITQPTNSQLNQPSVFTERNEPRLVDSPFQRQLQQIAPKKPSHFKEIMLLVILLTLVGVLITTIVLKDTILSWFSA